MDLQPTKPTLSMIHRLFVHSFKYFNSTKIYCIIKQNLNRFVTWAISVQFVELKKKHVVSLFKAPEDIP